MGPIDNDPVREALMDLAEEMLTSALGSMESAGITDEIALTLLTLTVANAVLINGTDAGADAWNDEHIAAIRAHHLKEAADAFDIAVQAWRHDHLPFEPPLTAKELEALGKTRIPSTAKDN